MIYYDLTAGLPFSLFRSVNVIVIDPLKRLILQTVISHTVERMSQEGGWVKAANLSLMVGGVELSIKVFTVLSWEEGWKALIQ